MTETPPNAAGEKIVNKMAIIDSTKYTLDGRQSDLNADFIFIFRENNIKYPEKCANVNAQKYSSRV